MFRYSVTVLAALLVVGTAEETFGRGFGGFHGGGGIGGGGGGGGFGGGGFRGGARPQMSRPAPRPSPRPNMGAGRPGGIGGARPGAGRPGGLGGARPGAGGARPGGLGGARPGAGNLSRRPAGGRPGGIGGAGAGRPGGETRPRVPGATSSLGGALANERGASPHRSDLNSFLGMPSDAGLHSVASRGGLGSVSRGLESQGANPRLGLTTGRVGSGRVGSEALRNNRLHRVDHAGMHTDSNIVRRNFREHHGYDNYYGRDWYSRYPNAWRTDRYLRADMWAYEDWDYMSQYYGYGNTTPVYYDYGTNVVYNDGTVSAPGQDDVTSDQYYQQASDLADTGAQAQPADDDQWLPLGVFVVTDGTNSDANQVLQLAVNKDAVIRGNFSVGDKTDPVQGSVDKQTQRAAWTVGDDKDTVFETGLYNLTKEEASAIVHDGSDKTGQLTLTRLKKPLSRKKPE